MKTAPASVDAYIAGFPEPVQAILQQIRQTIREAAPGAQEKMSYGIPTFTLHGNLVHFGAHKTHIGFYPGSTGVEAFKADLAAYESSKGTIKFPIDQPLPLELIKRIVEYRVQENSAKKKKA